MCAKWIKLLTDYSRRLIIELDCGVKTKASNTIVRSQTFAKKNDSNAYFSEFLGANGRKINLDHEIGVQMGVKRLFKPEFVIFICLLVRLNLTFG